MANLEIQEKEILSKIKTIDTLFARMAPFKFENGAAAYYTILVEEKFPNKSDRSSSSFSSINQNAKMVLPNIKRSVLEKGRAELLREGMIAEVISLDDDDESFDFGREMSLPVSPLAIWESHKEEMESVLNNRASEFHENYVQDLNQAYKDKYGKYGMGITEGRITISFTKNWLLYTIANVLRAKPDLGLNLLYGSLGSFDTGITKLNIYENLLDKGLNMKVLYDEAIQKNLTILSKLKDRYGNRIELKHTRMSHLTIRRVIIGDKIAIDGRRIFIKMPDKQKNLYKNKELPYIGTVYTRSEDINHFIENFDASWSNALDVSECAPERNK